MTDASAGVVDASPAEQLPNQPQWPQWQKCYSHKATREL
jgi:hypothetical protein